MNKKLCSISIVVGVLALITGAFALVNSFQSKNYEKTKELSCKEYSVIPEKYIDRVPSDCITQYFSEREKHKINEQAEYRKAIEEVRTR